MIRIARGSGTSVNEVKILLEEHKKLKGLISNVGKTNLGKGNADKLNLLRNPNQVMGKLHNMIDPKTLSQMGGMENIMTMMKEMSKNPEMSEMMKSMQGGGAQKKRK